MSSDRDLENLGKSLVEESMDIEGGEEGSESKKFSSKTLLPSFASTPQPKGQSLNRTAMRTPSKENTILIETQNLIALQSGQTPLLGGENMELKQTPAPHMSSTPDMTPSQGKSSKLASSTPSVRNTPIRDDLHINKEQDFFENKMKDKHRLVNLNKGFLSLPKPQNQYNVALPDIGEEEDQQEEELEKDTADILLEQQKQEQLKEQHKLNMRSNPLKRGLPRPSNIPNLLKTFDNQNPQHLIHNEMVSLLQREAVEFPFSSSSFVPPSNFHLSEDNDLNESNLQTAQLFLQEEMNQSNLKLPTKEQITEAFQAIVQQEFIYIPQKKTFVPFQSASDNEKISYFSTMIHAIKKKMESNGKFAQSIEKKLSVYFKGYENRFNTLAQQILDLQQQIQTAYFDLNSYKELQKMEQIAIPIRTEEYLKLIEIQQQRELENQTKYQELKNLLQK